MRRRRSLVLCLPLLLALAPSPAVAQLFVFHLRGDQEVPPVPSLASGGCMGVLDQGAATFDVTCTHNVASATLIVGIGTLAGFGLLLFLLERAVPLRKATRPLLGRLVVNLAFSAFALAAATLLVRPAVEASLGRLAAAPFGVVHLERDLAAFQEAARLLAPARRQRRGP